MIISYNFNFINEKDFCVGVNDRSFQYGDGIFETICFKETKIYFFKEHIKRFKERNVCFRF